VNTNNIQVHGVFDTIAFDSSELHNLVDSTNGMKLDINSDWGAVFATQLSDHIGQVAERKIPHEDMVKLTNEIKELALTIQVNEQSTVDNYFREVILIVDEFCKKLQGIVEEYLIDKWAYEIKEMLYNAIDQVFNVYKEKYIDPIISEKGEVAVEAIISFKAMLDFILFVEQLMHINRFFYGASRAITAIDDMCKTLDEWLSECRPADELPKEYEYLVRWYKWWADGERSKHANDTELNGLIVLGEIRDSMVNYFESRWGKRIVEYGQDGMLVYSKDSSYIDRIRTKKHGYTHRTVERKQMREEYGIDERDVIFSIEKEEKI
jgi:hypothetical protein